MILLKNRSLLAFFAISGYAASQQVAGRKGNLVIKFNIGQSFCPQSSCFYLIVEADFLVYKWEPKDNFVALQQYIRQYLLPTNNSVKRQFVRSALINSKHSNDVVWLQHLLCAVAYSTIDKNYFKILTKVLQLRLKGVQLNVFRNFVV